MHNILKTVVLVQLILVTSQWEAMVLKSPASRVFPQPFVQASIIENIKAPRHWPLWGISTGDRWIPLTKGQQRGKCFHLMTSSSGYVPAVGSATAWWQTMGFDIKGTEAYYWLIGPRSATRFSKISSAVLDVMWSMEAVLNHLRPEEPGKKHNEFCIQYGFCWWHSTGKC